MSFHHSLARSRALSPLRRRKVRFLVGIVAVAATLVASLPGAQATSTTTGTPGFVAPGGVIKFEHYKNLPSVDYYPSTTATSPTITRPLYISPKTCAIANLTSSVTVGLTTYAPVSDLLQISVTGMSNNGPYLVTNDLGGVTNGNSCGSNGGKVSMSGTITIKPGTQVTGSFLSASAVVGAHYSAGLRWTASANGTQVTNGSGTNSLQGPASSGNASASNDNTVVGINPTDNPTTTPVYHPFDTLTLQPTGTAQATIDLSPGDLATDAPTTFNLGQSQDYSVDCSTQNTVANNSSGTSAQSATFQRLPNGYNPAKDQTCYKIGVTVNITPTSITVNGTTRDVIFVDNTTTAADGTPQQVHAQLTIVWKVNRYDSSGNLRTQASIAAELQRYIQIASGDTATPVQWCGAQLAPNTIGYPGPSHPASTPWCLISDHSDQDSTGNYIVQTQVYDGVGDPKIW
ncbi:MAG: hypothetical protein ACTHJM_03635 [Marmoricola sp.]